MKLNQIIACALLLVATISVNAEVLPHPQTTGGMPLMEAMNARKSSRDIDGTKSVSKQDLSNMLWAAWGITHDGKRTVATGMNRQELEFYVVTPTEISKYSAEDNTLTTVVTGDFREYAGKQPFALTAPINILIVGDKNKQEMADCMSYAAGAASQNIYLYCAQAGLKTVLRYGCDREGLSKIMKLESNKSILFVQTVGK